MIFVYQEIVFLFFPTIKKHKEHSLIIGSVKIAKVLDLVYGPVSPPTLYGYESWTKKKTER